MSATKRCSRTSGRRWSGSVSEIDLQLDGQGPLHEQIRKAFARKISARELTPGDRLPFESELTRSLNVSRMTVSRALQALADEGLIVRRRKAGSFVAEQVSHDTPMTIGVPRTDILAAGHVYRYELLSRTRTTAQQKSGGEAKILHLTCRHLADDVPMLFERRWINLDAVPSAANESFDDTPPGEWLLNHVPWNEAENVISAVAADPDVAARLDIAPGSPCLRLDRKTWSGMASGMGSNGANGQLTITQVTLIYPGDRKTFVGRFQPAGEQAGAG